MAELQTQNGSIEAHALARHVRMSPQKARLVMDLIRGQKAQAALQTLRYTPKRAAKHIEKVLRSAIANAERKAEDAGAPPRCRRAVREHLLRQRRRALEAFASRADGPRVPLSEAHRASLGLALRSITWPRRSASPPSKRKPKRKRVFVAPRVVCAKALAGKQGGPKKGKK